MVKYFCYEFLFGGSNICILGPSFIRLNQSALRPRKQQETEIRNEHKNIYSNVEHRLGAHPHFIPTRAPIFKQYSNQLLEQLNRSYFAPLSYKDYIQAREQDQIIISIRRTIRKDKLVIRRTDKGNNFYIGSSIEYEKKVQKYFSDTNAFTELNNNPFNEILDKVIRLLNQLAGKKCITQGQCKDMMPDRKTAELSHLYFNPKTHKV